MAASGTSIFDLDIVELVEEAYEQAGVEARSGYDMRTARRSLNLLSLEWANKGYNLWTIEERTLPLIQATGAYQLDADIIDLIDFVLRDNLRDTSITRVPLGIHVSRNDKLSEGRPTQIYVDRQGNGPLVNLWPLPSEATFTLVYWAMRRIQDAGDFSNTFDAPTRMLPALIAGLAHKLAEKKKPDNIALISRLEGKAEKLFAEATSEDRDRSDYYVFPDNN